MRYVAKDLRGFHRHLRSAWTSFSAQRMDQHRDTFIFRKILLAYPGLISSADDGHSGTGYFCYECDQ
eukprot:8108773-Pyramimonas_sp.AAC.1